WKLIRQRVADASVVPVITGLVNLEDLAERERLIVPHIDGERTIEEIALQTHNAEFTVARFVYEGVTKGWMAVAEAAPRRKTVAAAGSGGSIELDVENFLERGRASLREAPQAAYRMFKAASDLAPTDGRATEAVRDAEREIRSRLSHDGVTG